MFTITRPTRDEYKYKVKRARKQKNDELKKALQRDFYGYGKPDMTAEERIKEIDMLQRFLSLDFMMEDDDDSNDDVGPDELKKGEN